MHVWLSDSIQKYGCSPLSKNLLISAAVLAVFTLMVCMGEAGSMEKKKNHVVLLGASVGHDWKIESLPKRLNKSGLNNLYSFEFIGAYEFDKTRALTELLQRKQNKPDIIILKECAAYFPGIFPKYQEMLKAWVRQCREADVAPIIATVVPVVKQNSLGSMLKDTVKVLLGRPSSSARLKQILKYNDWAKSYGDAEGVAVLDLESCVRVSSRDRSLRKDLHNGDGLHLNRTAYDLLDEIIVPALDLALEKKRTSASAAKRSQFSR